MKPRNPVVRELAKNPKKGGKHQVTRRKKERQEKDKLFSR